MTRNLQKEKEKEQFEAVLKSLNINCTIDKQNESPDFEITIEGRKTGVEITEVYRDLGHQNAAETQSNIRYVCKKAADLYNQKQGLPISFSLTFDGGIPVSDRKRLALALADFLLDSVKKENITEITTARKLPIDLVRHPMLSQLQCH